MSINLTCTNPACETSIPVPEGAIQVICPNCDSWHFPKTSSHSSKESVAQDTNESSSNLLNEQMPPVLEDLMPQGEDQGASFQRESFERDANEMEIPQQIEPIIPQSIQTNEFENVEKEQSEQIIVEQQAFLMTQTGEKMPLSEGVNVIGRNECDLVIDDNTVSRRHCAVEVQEKPNGSCEVFIYDIGHIEGKPSTNGVFIEGRSLRLQDYERIPIRSGTAITIGNVNLNFYLENTSF